MRAIIIPNKNFTLNPLTAEEKFDFPGQKCVDKKFIGCQLYRKDLLDR